MKPLIGVILLSTMAALASGSTMDVTPGCCYSCVCSTELDCGRCPACRWTTAGCSVNYGSDCCKYCSCASPGECLACGCCVDWSTYQCHQPPCEDSTTSSTQTTSTTERRRVITTSTTTTTLYRHPTVYELLPPTTVTTATSSTSTTVTSTSTSSTSTSSTTSTIPAPSCDDGKQNQGEGWIDCGGPCARCAIPGVSASVENPPYVMKGDSFTVTVRLRSNQSGPYSVRLEMPEGFEWRPSRGVYLKAGEGSSVAYTVRASDYVDRGDHMGDVVVRDIRGLEVAEAETTVTVEEHMVLGSPVGDLRLPSLEEINRKIKDVRERVVRLVNNTTRILYSTLWLWVLLVLILLFLPYLYYMRVRKQPPG